MPDRQQPEVFWGEIAPCDHFVQIYSETGIMLDTLEQFVSEGLRSGDSVIVIATPIHRNTLEARMRSKGFDLDGLIASGRFIERDAAAVLAHFMVNGWPDEALFRNTIGGLLGPTRAGGRRVRAFGEMVAVLWAEDKHAATVRLEHLWHQLCEEEKFSLFCAYPKIGFTQDVHESISAICDAHSRVVAG